MYKALLARSALSILAVLSATRVSDAAWARFTFNSQPGDFIGQGQVRDIIYDSIHGSDIEIGYPLRLETGEPTMVDFVLNPFGDGSDFATLTFGTDRLGIALQTGFYPNAQRARFAAAGHPGLAVGFQHRGCSTLTGNFTITELALNPEHSIDRLAASFEQHCSGAPPALFGTFTYYSIPEPATILTLSACGLSVIVRQRSRCWRSN